MAGACEARSRPVAARPGAARAPPPRQHASADELWEAAQAVRAVGHGAARAAGALADPGLARDITLRRAVPRAAVHACWRQGEHALVSGLVGRIWTLRRDYPQLDSPRGVPRLVRARHGPRGVRQLGQPERDGGASSLVSEARVQAIGSQGRIGVAAVRPVVRGFQNLIGSEGIAAAVARRAPARQRAGKAAPTAETDAARMRIAAVT